MSAAVIDLLSGRIYPCKQFFHWDKVKEIVFETYKEETSKMSIQELDKFIMETFAYRGASKSTINDTYGLAQIIEIEHML